MRTTARPALLSRAVVNGVLVVGGLYTLLPLTWLLFASTKSVGDLFSSGFSVLGGHFGDNVRALVDQDDGIYGRWYLNSVLYAGGGALLGTGFAVLAGYAFDKFAFAGKEKWFGVVLLGVLVPNTALALPLYLLATKVGVVNTFAGVLIPVIANPFGVYLARTFSSAYVPGEVLEAARVDGAGELRTFLSVGLPMLAPGFVTIFLFQFVTIWNNFFLPLVMVSNPKLYPLSLGLYTWNSQVRQDPAYYAPVVVGALAAVLPLVLVFVSLQRYWKAGMTAGSVK